MTERKTTAELIATGEGAAIYVEETCRCGKAWDKEQCEARCYASQTAAHVRALIERVEECTNVITLRAKLDKAVKGLEEIASYISRGNRKIIAHDTLAQIREIEEAPHG